MKDANIDASKWTIHEISLETFKVSCELGLGIRVETDGRIVVNELRQARGYAELKCPELKPGDVLVAINNEPVVKKRFDEIMKLLQDSTQSRPTQLTFLHIGSSESAEKAVEAWLRDYDGQQEEAEFDVVFQPGQATGIRFTEGYIMTNPLRLQHIESQALEEIDPSHKSILQALVNQVIVRIGIHYVLGAPVDEVMALLKDETKHQKEIWFANPDQLNQDYHILTLQNTKHLKFFSFVPVPIMMEVPSVSFAVCNTSGSIYTREQQQQHNQVERSDGVRCDQYLMAINGIPTLRISTYGGDNDYGNSVEEEEALDRVRQKIQSTANQSEFMYVITKALDRLIPKERTLTFRDLEIYQKEYKAQRPLSPWKRRRPVPPTSSKPTSTPNTRVDSSKRLIITLKPRNFFRLLLEEHANKSPSVPDESKADQVKKVDEQEQSQVASRRSPLESCEGKRRKHQVAFLNQLTQEHVRQFTVPDSIRPIGIQLETNVSLRVPPLTIFKNFVRSNGIAFESKQIQVGDVLLAINDVPIEEIPTDLLIQMLQQEPTTSGGPLNNSKVKKLRIARQKPESNNLLRRLFLS